jgi:hypothetical protein
VSNCIIWAFCRFFTRGGYVLCRKSHYGWWPHFLWSPDLKTFYDYQPEVPNHHLLIPPPLYRGVVRKTSPCGYNFLVRRLATPESGTDFSRHRHA